MDEYVWNQIWKVSQLIFASVIKKTEKGDLEKKNICSGYAGGRLKVMTREVEEVEAKEEVDN